MSVLHMVATAVRADAVELGLVSVHRVGVGDTTARCSCGWAGRRRFLKVSAMQDAWAHSAQEGCDVATPFVVTW